MKGFDLADLSEGIARLVATERWGTVDQQALSAKVQDVLFGTRGLWHACKSDLVTLDEAAEAATAHLETWFEETGVIPAGDRKRYRSEAVTLIREALQKS